MHLLVEAQSSFRFYYKSHSCPYICIHLIVGWICTRAAYLDSCSFIFTPTPGPTRPAVDAARELFYIPIMVVESFWLLQRARTLSTPLLTLLRQDAMEMRHKQRQPPRMYGLGRSFWWVPVVVLVLQLQNSPSFSITFQVDTNEILFHIVGQTVLSSSLLVTSGALYVLVLQYSTCATLF